MSKKALSILILTALLTALPGLGAAQASPTSPTVNSSSGDVFRVEQIIHGSGFKETIRTPDGKIRVIVQLSDAPVATYAGTIPGFRATSPQVTGAGKLNMQSDASLAYADYLKTVQSQFLQDTSAIAPSVEGISQFQGVINAVSIALDPAELPALSRMRGVANIYPDQIRTSRLDASLDLIHASSAWDLLSGRSQAGNGIIIADIDSGLYVNNPMFSGEGFSMPPGYPKGFCAAFPADPDFQCTNKVISARAFWDPDLHSLVDGAELPYVDDADPYGKSKPVDVDGHGTHTAGTAAGNEVTLSAPEGTVPAGTTISGVAPGAYLMVYKALFERFDRLTAIGSDSSLVAALEAALSDGADIINNSWGGGPGSDPNASIYKPVVESLTAAGIVVVFSAGNEGPEDTTIDCPGCIEDTIAVAASTTNRIFGNPFSITGPGEVPAGLTNIPALQGTGPLLSADINAPIKYDAGNPDGCLSFADDFFSESIALVQRGTCSFSLKITNASVAGALAVIVFNNEAGPPALMGFLESSMVPSAMISMLEGEAVRDFIAANPTATASIASSITRMTNDAFQDVMASFSSQGPNGDAYILKPDMTAPGVNILSAFSPILPDAHDFGLLQGTSMAAPHVTGAAALMAQLHPEWTPRQIKTALMSTSVQALMASDGVTPANPFSKGAGRLDLDRATKAGLTFDQASFANPNCILSCSWTTTVQNVTDQSVTWTSLVTADPGLGISVSPPSITLPPGLSGQFTINVDSTNLEQGAWGFGAITWTDSSQTYTDATLPLAVQPGTATNSMAFTKTVDKEQANIGDTLTYTFNVTNLYPADGEFTVTDVLPQGLEFVEGSQTEGLSFDAASRTVFGTTDLAGADFSLTPTAEEPIYSQLPELALGLNQFCGTGCDDEAIIVTGFNFFFNGVRYSKMAITTNGYVIPTNTTITSADVTATNQRLPNSAVPNNVIAPLWTDLDLLSGDIDDPGAGSFSILVTNTHTIIDYRDVQQFGDKHTTYNFQIWIEDGTDHIFFTYGSLPDTIGNFNVSVGAEDATGSLGVTHFYVKNGVTEGTAPDTETDLALTAGVDSAEMSFQANIIGAPSTPNRIDNVATLYNNINADVMTATASTQLLEGSGSSGTILFFPVINR